MAARLRQAKTLRESAVDRISILYNLAEQAKIDKGVHSHFKARSSELKSFYSEFNIQHTAIITMLSASEDADVGAETLLRQQVDDQYYNILTIHSELFDIASTPDNKNQTSTVKLPKLNIPVFSGDMKLWPTFFDLYKSLIHNNTSLSSVEKFRYLISSLSGEALILVKNINLTEDNYEVAYKKLVKHFQNIRALATFYWEQIYNTQKINLESPKALRQVLALFFDNLEALKNLGLPVNDWDFILFHMLSKKIDSETLHRFEQENPCPSSDIPKYHDLYKFLEKQCDAYDSVVLVHAPKKSISSSNKSAFIKTAKPQSSTFLTNTEQTKCALCKSDHSIYKCSTFSSKTPKERFELSKQYKWCTNCLGSKHSTNNCSSSSGCKICQKRHHTLLHFDELGAKPVGVVGTTFPSIFTKESSCHDSIPGSSATVLHTSVSSCNLLPTAQVEVLDSRGHFQKVKVLIDGCSQVSLITEKCAKRLGLPRFDTPMQIGGVEDSGTFSRKSIHCTLKPLGKTVPSFNIDAQILSKICNNMPVHSFSTDSFSHTANLDLADKTFNISSSIDMLLEVDVFSKILKPDKIQGAEGEPTAVNTSFGWILMGKMNVPHKILVHSFLSSCLTSLDSTLQKFWELEGIPPSYQISDEDKKCETIFQESYIRLATGRFGVSLPFKSPNPFFGDTRTPALKRLKAMELRLLKDSQLYSEYNNFMKDYLSTGHMVRVEPPSSFERVYYIPHHCVKNPNSNTTRLRVVFDASFKSPMGISLNDSLLVGQKLQKDIVGILLRFRLHPFVFIADIKQMYRQILITEEDQNYQRILWRFSPQDPVQDFKLTTVTYGVSSAPFLALRTINQLAHEERKYFPRAATSLSSDIYIDDVITGAFTIEEAKLLQSELISMLAKGGFVLRKWACNHPDLMQNLPPDDCQHSLSSFDSHDFVIKVLGLRWNNSLDTFSYEVQPLSRSCSKRIILSEVARMYDPVGFLAPLSFFAKYMLQYLWSLGLDWDEIPPQDLIDKWAQYKSELPLLSQISIPRCLPTKFISCELHGFSDSSEKGYSAVTYFRFTGTDNTSQIYLISAKTRVAPLKVLSIPRLELCAAVLLADLIDFILGSFQGKIKIDEVFAWSDSMVTLSWIKSPAWRWKTFVSHRVAHIQERVAADRWHFVQTTCNPADCASRGLLPGQIINHSLWFFGPPWLINPRKQWPESSISVVSCPEEKPLVLTTFVSLDTLDYLLNKFSSLNKIKRVIGHAFRFIHNIKYSTNKIFGPFTDSELQSALLILVKRVQHLCFSSEIENLIAGTALSKPFRKLNPFIDKGGILRVGGRLQFSGLAYDQKYPAILPRQHRLTDLIVESIHKEHCHPGLQHVHFLISQNFWILSAKRAIRRVLNQCHRCFRLKPVSYTPFMGNLPPRRINQIKPFACVGVDYGGPFLVTPLKGRGIKSQKAYICLFVCFATKALHLELVSSLSSDAFVAALRRFVARRGRCSQIFCDNGTNFIGASRMLNEYMQLASESEGIKFSFSPPSGPHFNGLSEAGIKSVKSHIFRVVGSQVLTFEEFYTLLTQIEAILNSRPLYPLSSDPNDLSVLTPGHFLMLEPPTAVPDPDLTHLKLNQLDRWQLLQRLQQDVWKRWHTEYLNTLQQRNKWLNKENPLKPDDLVIIKEDNSPSLHWKLGRIVKVFPGSDGIARVANVKTAQGLLQRPMVKLCPLPSFSV